jgi:hypothetical protein
MMIDEYKLAGIGGVVSTLGHDGMYAMRVLSLFGM